MTRGGFSHGEINSCKIVKPSLNWVYSSRFDHCGITPRGPEGFPLQLTSRVWHHLPSTHTKVRVRLSKVINLLDINHLTQVWLESVYHLWVLITAKKHKRETYKPRFCSFWRTLFVFSLMCHVLDVSSCYELRNTGLLGYLKKIMEMCIVKNCSGNVHCEKLHGFHRFLYRDKLASYSVFHTFLKVPSLYV